MVSVDRRVSGLVLLAGVVLSLAVLLASQPAWGQTAASSIYGTVTDASGAIVPGVKITVTNTATQVSRETTTDGDGHYEVLNLAIGTYRVTAEHKSFRRLATDPMTLQINQSLRVNLKMEVGSVAEIVEVTAQASAVETADSTLGASVTSRPIVNLPLNGRNVLSLALLQPGVTESDGSVAAAQFSVAGGRADSVLYLLDGAVNTNLLSNTVVYNPNPDTIAEFKILTNSYTAEYGRNAGGIVTVVTKSGTNQYHGSVFEFLRNDAFNANKFFRNEQGLSREVLKRNQFGATVGGPITLPKLVHGTDRFFFFFGYQGQRLVQQQTNPAQKVFTPAQLSGDFSNGGQPGNCPNKDAKVAAFLQKFPFFQSVSSKAACAMIDPARFDPVAQNYIKAGLIPSSPNGTVFPVGGAQDNIDELVGRFDAVITSKDRLALTLGSRRRPQLIPFTTEGNVGEFPVTTTNHQYFANIGYTRIFSPYLLNEFRFSTQRNNNLQNVPARTLPKPNDLGITGVKPDNPTGPTELAFATGMTLGFSRNGPSDLVDNTFQFSDTVTWIHGKHDLKFGASFVAYQDNQIFDFFINGRYRFRSTGFSSNDFADFLMGLPFDLHQFPAAPSNIRTKATYVFAQDEWHIRKRLTLNYGLRYEYSTPKLDTQGRTFSAILGQQSKVFVNAPLGLVFPGDANAPTGSNFPDKKNFAPRVGFAWDPWGDGKTSIRGGFGIFYDVLKGEDNFQFNGQAPFFSSIGSLRLPALKTNPTGPLNYLSDPFAATGAVNPFPSKPPASNLDFVKAGFLPFGGASVDFVDPHLRTPYVYQYSLSIQHELAKHLLLETSYVGSDSHKLTEQEDINPFILGDAKIERVFNAQPGVPASAFDSLFTFTNAANASFNSLEVGLLKRPSTTRFFGTTYFTLGYTYGHSIDLGSGFRDRNSQVPFYNPKLFRASSDYDIQHRITFSGGWDLPFDQAWSSGPKRLTTGWSVYPIVTWHTGFPLDVFANNLTSGIGTPGPSGAGDAGLVHANLVGSTVTILDPKAAQTFGSGNFWFNPANFTEKGLDPTGIAAVTNPALRTYGTLPRNFFRGPSFVNFDFALAKTTRLYRERLNLEFRAEFFNILNHAQFRITSSATNPTVNDSSSLFGRITDTFDPRIIQFAARVTF